LVVVLRLGGGLLVVVLRLRGGFLVHGLLLGLVGLVGLLVLGDLLGGAYDLFVADLPAPALGLVGLEDRAGLHMTGEVAQVRTGASALGSPDVAGLLEETLRVVLEDG